MIHFQDVSKEYQSGEGMFQALSGVTLNIEQGEFVSILGPSGSGKSTLLHLAGGLDRPSTGSVNVNGKDLGQLSARLLSAFRNREVGFVFQFFNLLPGLRAMDNVCLPLIYAGSRGADRRARASATLTALGLGDKLGSRPGELSGGEQQRVAIARALVSDPPVILADEPTGNLDSATGAQIIEILSLFHKSGKTLVVVTHDEKIAARASRIIRMRDGQIA